MSTWMDKTEGWSLYGLKKTDKKKKLKDIATKISTSTVGSGQQVGLAVKKDTEI